MSQFQTRKDDFLTRRLVPLDSAIRLLFARNTRRSVYGTPLKIKSGIRPGKLSFSAPPAKQVPAWPMHWQMIRVHHPLLRSPPHTTLSW